MTGRVTLFLSLLPNLEDGNNSGTRLQGHCLEPLQWFACPGPGHGSYWLERISKQQNRLKIWSLFCLPALATLTLGLFPTFDLPSGWLLPLLKGPLQTGLGASGLRVWEGAELSTLAMGLPGLAPGTPCAPSQPPRLPRPAARVCSKWPPRDGRWLSCGHLVGQSLWSQQARREARGVPWLRT